MAKTRSFRCWFILVLFFIGTFYVLTLNKLQQQNVFVFVPFKTKLEIDNNSNDGRISDWSKYVIKRKKELKELSNLGRMLYFNESYEPIEKNVNYTILTWKVGKFLERRHLKHFSDKWFDPFEKCSVKNCYITYNDSEVENADLVLFHLQRLKGKHEIPAKRGKPSQIWAFLTDESPYHTFLNGQVRLTDFNGIFNWSMTYRSDSDIPVPYGRTIPSHENEISDFNFNKWNERKKQDVLVAILSSNCHPINKRWDYVEKLRNYIKVDTYGKCGENKCDSNNLHYGTDCPLTYDYKFYLSFENSNCKEYITEKVWWQAYHKENIPVIMGSSKSTCERLLPPNSFLHVDDFASPEALANYIVYLNNTPSALQTYFYWKKNFEVANEHGYFQTDSYHYCRACEALNYNSKKKKNYKNLSSFWNTRDCYANWDVVFD